MQSPAPRLPYLWATAKVVGEQGTRLISFDAIHFHVPTLPTDLSVSPSSRPTYYKMPDSSSVQRKGRFTKPHDRSWTASLICSYVFDWVVLVLVAGAGGGLHLIEPNKRPFSLVDPNIAFPFTESETVPVWLLLVLNLFVPALIILLVCLIFVPGNTIPEGTPKSLIWKRKLWELHVGLLGLALAIVGAWFITNGMKNMFGKPRPDLLSRCEPDLANFQQYIIGGIASGSAAIPSNLNLEQLVGLGMLVSPDICKNTDSSKLDDGFRSYPSGHSSSAAAGLIYLSLFLASKFAVTIPFAANRGNATSQSAFPSRLQKGGSGLGPQDESLGTPGAVAEKALAEHHKMVTALRRQAAAPPIYLLCIVVVPFFLSVFISGSRWFDYRHHAFDILFGYLIGVLTSIFAFYYYHLPIRNGAGWAWGPRSHDKAWWSGVGSYSYATDKKDFIKISDEEEALGLQNYGRHSPTPNGSRATHRVFNGHAADHRDQGHEQTDYFDPASETPSGRRLDSRQDGQSMGHFDPYTSAQAR
ncbi:Diacylglycerol pyrophosphate phosphatase 1 like protein [Verticillium longisporum]|uniref:Diacylglycerol pyrophosphate phosphatase 1 like protein n=1 Tax=Verticillium longisporum TaxID=100787 RepID=A0A8I3AX82_VERLO|nr:Diacylglycerol pyrophosphate phosphatase 1 like protein [Verticillium longisporum]